MQPQPVREPDKEVRGPTFKSIEEARTWALFEVGRLGSPATYIIYRDLYWDAKLGMEMAKEKLK